MDLKPKSDSICDFCLETKSKYSCSRCRRKYCSVDCFKSLKHIDCSEQFFKQCVTQELLSQPFDDSSKRKILEILKRNNNQLMDELASEDIVEESPETETKTEESFESRFANLELTDWRHLLDQLSDSERQEFEELLRSGRIGDFVDVWKPWWESSNHSLVTPLDQTLETKQEVCVSRVPELLSNVLELNSLISKPVSKSVCPSVVNSLFSYCYICRLFNGEYDSIESIETFIEKCVQISKNINCDELSQSLEMSIQAILTEQPLPMVSQLLSDLKCVINGPKLRTGRYETPEYVLRALSDLICIINNVKKKCSKKKRKDLKLELIAKKLEFYMSWSVANGSDLFDCVNQIDLMIETIELSNKCFDSEESAEDLRRKLRPKELIEELA